MNSNKQLARRSILFETMKTRSNSDDNDILYYSYADVFMCIKSSTGIIKRLDFGSWTF